MQQAEIETIHLYVVREEEKQPYTVLPLFFAFLCLVGIAALTFYSGEHPTYEYKTFRTALVLLPLKTFTASAPIIPTGVKTYPATVAEGTLTITNGSVISQTLPAGIIFTGNDGVEVITDTAVFVPAGSAAGYGVTTVSAHTVTSGQSGNIPAYDVNHVVGSSVYIRNLQPFTGGQNAYSVKIITPHDRQAAFEVARAFLAVQEARIRAILIQPCKETASAKNALLSVLWACRFAAYPRLPGYHINKVRIEGRNFLVDVAFTPYPRTFPEK